MDKIERFANYHLGMFVHFGIYSVYGKGEWYMYQKKVPAEKYVTAMEKFDVKKDWTDDIIATAKSFGARYIVLTTRHHDGFSMFDTCGLNDYDVMHTPTGRDLVGEFVDACNQNGIKPFFYMTMIDWTEPTFKKDFEAYKRYHIKSVELLTKNYGEIGGFWFDGTWWKEDDLTWDFDALYGVIRRNQPNALIINNSGTTNLGAVTCEEVDVLTFEVNRPTFIEQKGKKRALEMCQTLNKHWGYAKGDLCYKSVRRLQKDYLVCREVGANYLINVGPTADGSVRRIDRKILSAFGKRIAKKDKK